MIDTEHRPIEHDSRWEADPHPEEALRQQVGGAAGPIGGRLEAVAQPEREKGERGRGRQVNEHGAQPGAPVERVVPGEPDDVGDEQRPDEEVRDRPKKGLAPADGHPPAAEAEVHLGSQKDVQQRSAADDQRPRHPALILHLNANNWLCSWAGVPPALTNPRFQGRPGDPAGDWASLGLVVRRVRAPTPPSRAAAVLSWRLRYVAVCSILFLMRRPLYSRSMII